MLNTAIKTVLSIFMSTKFNENYHKMSQIEEKLRKHIII